MEQELHRKFYSLFMDSRARLMDQQDVMDELLAKAQGRDALIADLLVENEALKHDVAFLKGQLAKPLPEPKTYRVSEEEQEAEWQLEQGIIDAKEYEHLLKELDFQNANIELDPDYTPRQPTY